MVMDGTVMDGMVMDGMVMDGIPLTVGTIFTILTAIGATIIHATTTDTIILDGKTQTTNSFVTKLGHTEAIAIRTERIDIHTTTKVTFRANTTTTTVQNQTIHTEEARLGAQILLKVATLQKLPVAPTIVVLRVVPQVVLLKVAQISHHPTVPPTEAIAIATEGVNPQYYEKTFLYHPSINYWFSCSCTNLQLYRFRNSFFI